MGEIKKVHIKNINDLLSIKNEWEKLENGEDMTAFQSFDWNCLLYEKWKSVFINRIFSKCFVYMYLKNSTVKMILPIIVKNKTFKDDVLEFNKGIYFLGDSTHSDYLNFIYSKFDEESFSEIINCLKKDFSEYQFYLNKIREDSCIAKHLEKINIKIESKYPSVNIKMLESQDLFDGTLSKSVRQNLRTSKNRMDKANLNYNLKVLNGTADKETIALLLKMHKKRIETIRQHEYDSLTTRYRKRLQKIYKMNDSHERKYDIVYNSMSKLENSIFIIVELNEKKVGYLYGLKEKKSIRIIHNCFDEEYSFYSPMFRGIYDFIADECNNHRYKIEQLDFTLGDESYKLKLGGIELLVYSYIM